MGQENLQACDAVQVLRNVFGYKEFRPPQKEVIDLLLQGKDAFVLMPTGGGKSLCYQIPALLRRGTGIVISPLISLMKDQVDSLRACGIKAAYLNSSLSAGQANEITNALLRGELDLLYVAPERLLGEKFLACLDRIEIALFAIDEAHCVSHWGHDFRPEYERLGLLRQRYPQVPILALTATADHLTRKDILKSLGLEGAKTFVSSFDRPNIRYLVLEKRKPMQQLLHFLEERKEEAGIVYCMSRRRVEDVAVALQRHGFLADAYHAGLPSSRREKVQDDFLRDRLRIIVATIAFGMGVDKPNIRYVVHYDLPKSIESYYQETGRAGRDGLDADALLLYGPSDVARVRLMIENVKHPEQKNVELHKLDQMVAFAEGLSCRRQALLAYFGESLQEPCGNCDICLEPPETYDASDDVHLALSCVDALGERYAISYLVQVLKGAKNERIRKHGHERVPVYGQGSHRSADEWAAVYRQLIHLGYLTLDLTAKGALRFTEKGREALKGHARINLALSTSRTKQRFLKPKRSMDEKLFAKLKALRHRIAEKEGLAPHAIFSDATLAEMSLHKPLTRDALENINGVGRRKCEVYGEPFLACIRNGAPPRVQSSDGEPQGRLPHDQLSEIQSYILECYRQGKGPADIASELGISESSVLKHSVGIVRAGFSLDIRSIVGDAFEVILQALENADPYMSLSEVKHSLPIQVSNECFRLVLTWREAMLQASNAD